MNGSSWLLDYKRNSKRITLKQHPDSLPSTKQPLDSNYFYPYRISLERLDHLPVNELQTCKHLELRFTFFDKSQAMFFGNTFVSIIEDSFLQSSTASISLMNATKYSCNLTHEQIYFHTNSTNQDIIIVIEVAALRADMNTGNEYYSSVGWTFFHPFNPSKGGMDPNLIWKTMENKSSQNFQIPIYQGTPRILPILFGTLKDIPNMHHLSNSNLKFKFSSCFEINSICSAFPQFTFSTEDYLPFDYSEDGLVFTQTKSNILANIFITCPDITALEKSFLNHVSDTISSISTKNEIVERRVHVGYHNSYFYAQPPKLVHLQPVLNKDGDCVGYRFEGEVEVKNVKDTGVLVFILEYRIRMHVRRNTAKRSILGKEEEELVEFVKDVSLGWAFWEGGKKNIYLQTGAAVSPYGKFSYVPEDDIKLAVTFDVVSPGSPKKKKGSGASERSVALSKTSVKTAVLPDNPIAASITELNTMASPKKDEIRRSNMDLNLFEQSSAATRKIETVKRSNLELNEPVIKRSMTDLRKSSNELKVSSSNIIQEVKPEVRKSFNELRRDSLPKIDEHPPVQPQKNSSTSSITGQKPPAPLLNNGSKQESNSSILPPVTSNRDSLLVNIPQEKPRKRNSLLLSGLNLPPILPQIKPQIDMNLELKDSFQNEIVVELIGLDLFQPGTIHGVETEFVAIKSMSFEITVFNSQKTITRTFESLPTLFQSHESCRFTLPYEDVQEALQINIPTSLKYLAENFILIRCTWDECSMPIGTVRVPAAHTLRQGKEKVEYFVPGDIMHENESRGVLYFKISNIGIPALKQRRNIPRSGVFREQKDLVQIPKKIFDSNADMREKVFSEKLSSADFEKLGKVISFNHENEYGVNIKDVKMDLSSKQFSVICDERSKTERFSVLESLKKQQCRVYEISMYSGQAALFDYSFQNPYMKSMEFTLKLDDPRLRIVDEDMSGIKGRLPVVRGREAMITLHSNEKISFWIVFQGFSRGTDTLPINVFSSQNNLCGYLEINAKVMDPVICDIVHDVPKEKFSQVKEDLVYVYSDKSFTSLVKTVKVMEEQGELIQTEGLLGDTASFGISVTSDKARNLLVYTSDELLSAAKSVLQVGASETVTVEMQVRCDEIGERKYTLHMIDSLSKQVVKKYQLKHTVRGIQISKTFDVSVPSGKISKKRVSYTNPFDSWKSFTLLTNKPHLIRFRNPVLNIDALGNEYIGLEFLVASPGNERIFIYLLEGKEIRECLLLRMKYL